MQPRTGCVRRSQEVGFRGRIDHPGWKSAAPNLPQPALAGRETPFLADHIEFREFRGRDVRRMPQAVATEGATLPIAETPESAPVPFQVLADPLEQMRSGGGEAVGFGRDLGARIQHVAPALGPPALGDVLASNQDDRSIARAPHRLGIFANPDHAAVLADFADLPAMRAANFFQA